MMSKRNNSTLVVRKDEHYTDAQSDGNTPIGVALWQLRRARLHIESRSIGSRWVQYGSR